MTGGGEVGVSARGFDGGFPSVPAVHFLWGGATDTRPLSQGWRCLLCTRAQGVLVEKSVAFLPVCPPHLRAGALAAPTPPFFPTHLSFLTPPSPIRRLPATATARSGTGPGLSDDDVAHGVRAGAGKAVAKKGSGAVGSGHGFSFFIGMPLLTIPATAGKPPIPCIWAVRPPSATGTVIVLLTHGAERRCPNAGRSLFFVRPLSVGPAFQSSPSLRAGRWPPGRRRSGARPRTLHRFSARARSPWRGILWAPARPRPRQPAGPGRMGVPPSSRLWPPWSSFLTRSTLRATPPPRPRRTGEAC